MEHNKVSSDQVYTLDQVAKHSTESDCWVVVNGQVLDVTSFLGEHPGGKDAILMFAGKDATEEFNMLHKPDTVETHAPRVIIGRVGTPSQKKPETKPDSPSKSSGKIQSDFTKPNNAVSLSPIEPLTPSSIEGKNSGGTEGLLDKERATATFEITKMIDFLNGGPEATKKKKFILGPSLKMNFDDKYNWSRTETLKQHVKHFYDVHKAFLGKMIPSRDEILWMTENSMLPGSLGNHYGLFLPTVMGMANDEQRNIWLPRTIMLKMIGCYCQTELGHGSNVRGLRTTATYDKKTQEFILDTPTLQASKWWPGALGKVATHAAVYAQLIIDGKEYGVHVFMLQIRDENHRPFLGIELGDLGPKLGDAANDTGFMRLHNVRIPRDMMFGRHQEVTPEGVYKKHNKSGKDDSKLHYATMMFTRGTMTKQAGAYLAQACTVATRYNCIRKQGFMDTKQGVSYKTPEYALMDYQITQSRIFKQIAWAYALKFVGSWLIERFKELTGETGNTPGNSSYVITNVDTLPEIASTTAGFKAIGTFLCAEGIEDLRKACGGVGYLLSSGIAAISQDYVWRVTAEGDWIILMLQTARFIVKTIGSIKNGKKIEGPYGYLNILGKQGVKLSSYAPKEAKSKTDFCDLEFLEKLFQYCALCVVSSVGLDVAAKVEKTGNFDLAAKDHQVDLINAVKIHSYYFMIGRYRQAIVEAKDPKLQKVLTRLCAFLANSLIAETQWAGIITFEQLKFSREAASDLLKQLRPDAVPLVDSFDIPDRVLCTTIGKYDGNVYEHLFEAALKSELNQSDPFDGQEHMKSFLDLKYLAQGNNRKSKL